MGSGGDDAGREGAPREVGEQMEGEEQRDRAVLSDAPGQDPGEHDSDGEQGIAPKDH
jgi:hypothetical protein